jgi:hypothetical protein
MKSQVQLLTVNANTLFWTVVKLEGTGLIKNDIDQ